MNYISVFSKHLGEKMSIPMQGSRMVQLASGWSDSSSGWVDSGWNNTSSWMDSGWNNTSSWSDGGWSNSK